MQWLSPAGTPGFSVPAGLRIRSGAVRPATAKHSFELYFRDEYGSRTLAYPLFGSHPRQPSARLILRAGGAEGGPVLSAGQAVYVREQLLRELHREMGQVAARGRWIVLYLNGAPWGLYQLTEHFEASAWYTSAPAGAPPPANAHRWHLLADWLTGADLSSATQYAQAVQQLDIESFTALILLRLWNDDTAWDSHDWLAARRRDGPDPRWKLFREEAAGASDWYGQPGHEAQGALRPILASLLQNPQYQAYFTAQVERHLAGALAPAAVRARLDALAAQLRPEMAAEAARWRPDQEPADALAQWEAALQRFSDSLDAKAQHLRDLRDPATRRQHLSQLAAPADTGRSAATTAGHPDRPGGASPHGTAAGRCRRRGAPEGPRRHRDRGRDPRR